MCTLDSISLGGDENEEERKLTAFNIKPTSYVYLVLLVQVWKRRRRASCNQLMWPAGGAVMTPFCSALVCAQTTTTKKSFKHWD